MITKRIDMRDAAKSRATRLAKYVTDELERAGRVAGVCAHLEKTLVLTPTNHEPGKNVAMGKAGDMEAHTDAESFLSFTSEKATPVLAAVRSWDELHRELAEAGISMRLKGNGLVMVDHAGPIVVKINAVGRDFSKAKLEKRLGAFVSCDASCTVPSAEKPQPSVDEEGRERSGRQSRSHDCYGEIQRAGIGVHWN